MSVVSTDYQYDWRVFCPACDYFKLYQSIPRRGMHFIMNTKCHECNKVHLDAVELGYD